MSIYTKLFGADNVVDAAVKSGDALMFTHEERSSWLLKFLAAYEPFKVAQRLMAFLVGIPFVAIHCLCFLVDFFGLFFLGGDGRLTAPLREDNIATLGEPFTWIVGFYFGGGAVEGVARLFTERGKK